MSAIRRHFAGDPAGEDDGAPTDALVAGSVDGVPDDGATSIGWHATAVSASSNASRTTPIYTCDAGRGRGRAFRARRVVPLGTARYRRWARAHPTPALSPPAARRVRAPREDRHPPHDRAGGVGEHPWHDPASPLWQTLGEGRLAPWARQPG